MQFPLEHEIFDKQLTRYITCLLSAKYKKRYLALYEACTGNASCHSPDEYKQKIEPERPKQQLTIYNIPSNAKKQKKVVTALRLDGKKILMRG
jgi:hypothetical protein